LLDLDEFPGPESLDEGHGDTRGEQALLAPERGERRFQFC